MKKIISFCIPVMNRLQDLICTLEHNLEVARKFKKDVEIVINCFDLGDETQSYINNNFKHDIDIGLLSFNNLPPLPFWHFCWAKNSFKKYIKGQYYASLDGDNFITEHEVKSTIELCQNTNEKYLMHLFSGVWGDGTSGRIILPKALYLKHGYLTSMFPRQFDEMALILSVLSNEDVTFVSRPGVNIFELSGYAKDFKINALNKSFKHLEKDFGKSPSPLMPRGEKYSEKDPKLNIYQGINAYYSMQEITKNNEVKSKYIENLKKQQEKAFTDFDISTIEHIIFKCQTKRPRKNGELTLYSVIKNDAIFLNKWYEHYKSIGVERFIIIDDNSDICTSEILNFDDVYVFRPRVGNFKLFKTFWIKTLCSTYQDPDTWVITVDSDEFIDTSGTESNRLQKMISTLDDRNIDYCGGILIDMLPEKKCPIDKNNFIELMNHHLLRGVNEEYGYQHIPSIKWAFSKFWGLSFEFDFRYRYYGTIDSLRKFPIFKFKKTVNINQGFHGLGYGLKEIDPKGFFGKKNIILPIKHYKFIKILSKEENDKLKKEDIGGYFERTRGNISKIINSDERYTVNLFFNSVYKTKYSSEKVMERIRFYKDSI